MESFKHKDYKPITVEDFVEKLPHLDWFQFAGVSRCTTLTTDFVERHIDKKWDWLDLSRNRVVTPELVERHANKPWVWGRSTKMFDRTRFSGLSNNPSITPEFVLRHLDKDWDWGYGGLSDNRSISMDLVEKTLDKPWNWHSLACNPAIKPEFVKYYLLLLEGRKLNDSILLGSLAMNPLTTPEFIDQHQDLAWPWRLVANYVSDLPVWFVEKYEHCFDKEGEGTWLCMSYNRSLNLALLRRFPEKLWNWASIFRNHDISLEEIQTLAPPSALDRTFYSLISRCDKVTPDVVECNLDKGWDWGLYGLSQNRSMTLEFIERHFDKPWSWESLSRNPVIDEEFVLRHSDKPWSLPNLSQNASISLDFISESILGDPKLDDLLRRLAQLDVLLNPNLTPEFLMDHVPEDTVSRNLSYLLFHNMFSRHHVLQKRMRDMDMASYL